MYPLGLDAGTATFNDLSTFTSSIGSGSFTQTFDCFGAGAVPSPLSISGGGYSISASDDSRTFFNVGPAPDVWLSTSSSDLEISFSFSGPLPTVAGGYFFLTDATGNFQAGEISVLLNNNTKINRTVDSSSSFLGLTSDGGISSIAFLAPVHYATVNNLVVGQVAPVAVPESSTLGLLGLGVLVLWSSYTWRRKTLPNSRES